VGISFLDAAEVRNFDSLVIALVRGLVRSQFAVSFDWCLVWKSVAQPLTEPQAYARDIAGDAVDVIANYMKACDEDCQ
jgi:hypothetical protein